MPQTVNTLDILKQVRIFSTLTREELKILDDSVSWKGYRKGERLFDEGEPADHMFIIASGQVKVVKEFPSGKNVIMGMFGKGGTVAEITAIDKLPYPASAVALEDTTAGSIKAELFVKFLKQHPDTLIGMIIGLGSKLREMVGNIGSLAVQSVEKRLARFLVKLSREIGENKKDGLLLTLPMTRQDLAEIIGTSFEVVERSLKKMREKGIVKVEGKKILILKPKQLESIFKEE